MTKIRLQTYPFHQGLASPTPTDPKNPPRPKSPPGRLPKPNPKLPGRSGKPEDGKEGPDDGNPLKLPASTSTIPPGRIDGSKGREVVVVVLVVVGFN